MIVLSGFRAIIFPCILISHVSVAANNMRAAKTDQGQGIVNMQGSIIDTPCAIATADREQSIEMMTTTVGQIIHNGSGNKNPFSLTLVNCNLHVNQETQTISSHFQTTFDGPSSDGLFSVDGASGVGLEITDDAGNVAQPGKALPPGTLSNGSQTLQYQLRLMSNRDRLKVGEYTATIRFKVDYF
ncbi:fimbrial protein [Citrobacter sp. ku-bf4]|nr:fimbrial protein [Citrobacter sp. ku-bf4]MBS0826709.1 type 1 fimbrial protein [Citrobacter amalonaticus]